MISVSVDEAPSTARRRESLEAAPDESAALEQLIAVYEEVSLSQSRKLEIAVADLRRSNSELARFAHAVSHDLQEPLRAVVFSTQLLLRELDGKLEPEANELAADIVAGVLRMRALIGGLLDYSQVGSSQIAPRLLEPAALLADVLADLGPALDESGAKVTCDALPHVVADPVQLGRVFQNLIANAIKFRGPEAPCIHISAEAHANEHVFSVADNGIGIDPSQHQRVFALFQRLHSPAEYRGLGLGLAIVKRIVEVHGGRIWLDSTEGCGARFFFSLPSDPSRSTPSPVSRE